MDFKIYFEKKNLKKIPKKGIHYEQKTTPDLIWCIANVILNFAKENWGMVFSDENVRSSAIFNSFMQDYFSKAPQEKAKNEYNKVSSYQLGLLAYSGVLEQLSTGPKTYKIKSKEALEYLAVNDFNAAKFLGEYTKKFLKDNDLEKIFYKYRINPSQQNYLEAKEAYWQWALVNTAVKGVSKDHTYRVFNKIFNVFCYVSQVPGEDGSNIKAGPCPYSFLIYNRENFRDKDMPAGMTRTQYREEVLSEIDRQGVVGTLEQKAKDAVKKKYNNDSEIKELKWGYASGRVVEAHHILPKHSYSQFSLSRENLIVLTPDQHRSIAHQGSYRTSSYEFQVVCLKKKFENIKLSIMNGEDFYNLSEFVKIINALFSWNLSEDSEVNLIESSLSKT